MSYKQTTHIACHVCEQTFSLVPYGIPYSCDASIRPYTHDQYSQIQRYDYNPELYDEFVNYKQIEEQKNKQYKEHAIHMYEVHAGYGSIFDGEGYPIAFIPDIRVLNWKTAEPICDQCLLDAFKMKHLLYVPDTRYAQDLYKPFEMFSSMEESDIEEYTSKLNRFNKRTAEIEEEEAKRLKSINNSKN